MCSLTTEKADDSMPNAKATGTTSSSEPHWEDSIPELEPNVNSQSKTVFSVELCRGYPKLLIACSTNFMFS